MKTYQVKKYFSWGSLQLEPLQYLQVTESEVENCLTVIQEKTGEQILVSEEAFANFERLVFFAKSD